MYTAGVQPLCSEQKLKRCRFPASSMKEADQSAEDSFISGATTTISNPVLEEEEAKGEDVEL